MPGKAWPTSSGQLQTYTCIIPEALSVTCQAALADMLSSVQPGDKAIYLLVLSG